GRTNRGRGSAWTSSGPAGRRRRSLASETGGAGAARETPLRGKTLPAPGAATLQDRAACTRGHPGTEAVTTLPPAHVGLIRPFHEVEEEGNCPKQGPWSRQYR